MAKFRKKPVVIEAEQYRVGMEDGVVPFGESVFLDVNLSAIWAKTGENPGGVPYIKTLEGEMFISPGDWIITGVKGEKYPCKPDIFEETYDAV